MPDNANALYDLGRLALALEQPAAALSFLDRALELDAQLSPAHVDRGRALHRLGREREAIQAMCRAVTIDPDAHAALNRLRWLLDEGQLRTTSALSRLAQRGLQVASVLDIGASDGQWSLAARRIWPDARYHLIEAFDHWRAPLEAVCSAQTGFSHAIAAAGNSDGEVWFYNDPDAPYGGAAFQDQPDGKERPEKSWKVPQVALAKEAERVGLKPPFLIKLDTHGFEVPILEGAEAILSQTNLVVIEVYVFHVHPQALLFHEICHWMAEKGFRPIDISEPLWRPRDGALWQFDLFFVPATQQEFACNAY
ncbi:hypothetical protein FH063_002202 [Azospirillum argentinense]|nr:hypothetical protein FH063_002202 [Azospirillum argentinense]